MEKSALIDDTTINSSASLNNDENEQMIIEENEKVAEKRHLVAKAVPKKERIGGKRLNPEITPSFL